MSVLQLTVALRQVELAYGKLSLPDWQQHSAALAEAVGGLVDLYLHVDARTGAYDPAPIYLDRQRVVLGLIPRAVEPLVRLLEAQTRFLDRALENGWRLPDTEASAWHDWHGRLARYIQTLERARSADDKPSEELWREVTAPLLQGLYPADFAKLGIVNPSVPSKPDVATVPSTAFMVALQSDEVGPLQSWLLSWREGIGTWMYDAKAAIKAVLNAAVEGATQGARKVARGFVMVALAGGLAFVGVRALRNHQDRKALRR